MSASEEHISGATAPREKLQAKPLALDRSWCPNPVADDAGRAYNSRTEEIIK
jgi:hypothetical protein